MNIIQRLNNRRILIWGYGREGKSTENFIKQYCTVACLDIYEGKADCIDEDKYDCIIKSPGINVEYYSEKYTSQTELFLEQFSAQTIGITGTKGKSTTSTMMYRVLSACYGDNVLLVGNIGLPCLDYYASINEDTIIVYEMSCHQLNHNKFSPHIAVFLNLYEDHLDYYKTKDNYFATKINITSHQSQNDLFFYGDNVPYIETAAQKTMICFDKPLSFDMKLKGAHNQFNATFVYKICTECYRCDAAQVRQVIADFTGLEHRMEFVAEINGVDYYNDSISTIPEATLIAIKSLPNVKTVLIGGMDRHIHYDILVDFIKNHGEYNYILSYESGERILKEAGFASYCYFEPDLAEAVKKAKEITPAGYSCVFSPAAASYGYFKNFEERGKAFKAAVAQDI